MGAEISLKLYGSLEKAFPHLRNGKVLPREDEAQPLHRFLAALGVDVDRIQLVMRNHRAVGFDSLVRPGDRLALFPREYPIFVDWFAFRRSD